MFHGKLGFQNCLKKEVKAYFFSFMLLFTTFVECFSRGSFLTLHLPNTSVTILILLRIVVFSDHLKANFWNSQEPLSCMRFPDFIYCGPLHKFESVVGIGKRPSIWLNLDFLESLGPKEWEKCLVPGFWKLFAKECHPNSS